MFCLHTHVYACTFELRCYILFIKELKREHFSVFINKRVVISLSTSVHHKRLVTFVASIHPWLNFLKIPWIYVVWFRTVNIFQGKLQCYKSFLHQEFHILYVSLILLPRIVTLVVIIYRFSYGGSCNLYSQTLPNPLSYS